MNREFRYWGESEHGTDSETSESGEDDDNVVINTTVKKSTISPAVRVATDVQCGLNRLRQENPGSCDVELHVGDQSILGHKIVLSACSLYFNAMFTHSFKEQSRADIVLNDLDCEIVNMLIDFIYSGELPYNEDNVQRILVMARFLQIDSAEQVCVAYVNEHINLKNCLDLIQWAAYHSVKSICDQLVKYISEHFYELYLKPGFSMIDFEEFNKIIITKPVRQFPADIRFTVVVRWINFDKLSRIQYLNTLLKTIYSSHVTKDLLLSPTLTSYLPPHSLSKWISEHPQMNLNDLTNWDFIVCKRTGHFLNKLYKPNIEATTDIRGLPKEYFDGSYVSYGSSVYYLGGCVSKQPISNETYCYNIYKNRWTQFIPMLRPRAYHRSYILNGILYTCGGSDGHVAFTSVECIDLISGQQLVLPEMLNRRESMGITAYNNAIFVIGGRNRGISNHYTCERFDPRIGEWELLKNFTYQAAIDSCATIGNSIYCTNGKSNSMERYDILADQWTLIYTQYKRYPCEVFEMKNELYGMFKDHIALYDRMTGKWKVTNQFGYHYDNLTALPIAIAPYESNIVTTENVNMDQN